MSWVDLGRLFLLFSEKRICPFTPRTRGLGMEGNTCTGKEARWMCGLWRKASILLDARCGLGRKSTPAGLSGRYSGPAHSDHYTLHLLYFSARRVCTVEQRDKTRDACSLYGHYTFTVVKLDARVANAATWILIPTCRRRATFTSESSHPDFR